MFASLVLVTCQFRAGLREPQRYKKKKKIARPIYVQLNRGKFGNENQIASLEHGVKVKATTQSHHAEIGCCDGGIDFKNSVFLIARVQFKAKFVSAISASHAQFTL